MLNKLCTEMYELHVLTPDQKDFLSRYGPSVECADGVVPNVYGIYNKETHVYEHYCANMPQAMSIMTTLQQGIDQEREVYEKKKPELRSV